MPGEFDVDDAVSCSPGDGARTDGPPEPWALKFAWLIVVVAATVSVSLIVAQVTLGWPFEPTRRTTVAEAINGAGRVVTLTETSLDAGGGRDALFRTVTGIAALTAGLLAWGRLEMSRRQNRLDRQAAERAVDAQRLAVRAQDATERSQITDRFTKAVEQLGNADLRFDSAGCTRLRRWLMTRGDGMTLLVLLLSAGSSARTPGGTRPREHRGLP